QDKGTCTKLSRHLPRFDTMVLGKGSAARVPGEPETFQKSSIKMENVMISERKKEANRQNAQKSTGPRTEQGKAKSRRNALKHGMTSEGTVLTPEDTELFQERMHGWTLKERPEGELDTYLLGCAVLASVHID